MFVDLKPNLFRFRVTSNKFVPDLPMPSLPGFRLEAWFGVAHRTTGETAISWCVQGDAPLTSQDWQSATGEWIAVLRDEHSSKFVVLGDYFGHQRIFFSRTETEVIISTDYDALVRATSSGAELGIRWEYLIPTLTTNNVFAAGAWSRATMHRHIHELFPGEGLIISNHEVGRFRKPFRQPIKPTDYDSLLDQGIEKAIKQLSRINDFNVKEIRLTLSGGRDSRVVLALALAAGIGDKLNLASSDPASFTGASRDTVSKDLEIAQAIGESLGLPNAIDGPHASHLLSFTELIDGFQSRNSGGSYGIPNTFVTSFPVKPRVELRGGGGELLRGAFSAWHSTPWWHERIQNHKDTLGLDARRLFDVVMRGDKIHRDLREPAIKLLVSALREGEPQNLAEALSNHYHVHRNRWHFGQRMAALAENRMMLFPLEQPELYSAANLLDPDLRRSGLVAFDMIQRLAPELNNFPFDNAPGWPSEVLNQRGLDREMLSAPEASSTRLAQTRSLLKQNSVKRAQGAPPQRFRPAQVAAGRSNSYMELLQSVSPRNFPDPLRSQIAEMMRTGRLNPLQTVSRLHSALAKLLPDASPFNELTWCNSDASHTRQVIHPQLAEQAALNAQDVALSLIATRTESQVKAQLTLLPDDDLHLWEFAFYLMADGERVDSIWYTDSTFATFTTVPQPESNSKSLAIRAFARRKSATPTTHPLIIDAQVVPNGQ